MPDIVCTSPVDGRELVRRPTATGAEIEDALARARAAQRKWANASLGARVAAMLDFLDRLKAMNGEIVPELAWSMGRPVRYGGEMRGLEERVRHMAAIANDALAPYVPEERPGFRRMIKREPLGLVLVIAPWNYPYLTAVNAVVPALIAGNAVILKTAAQTLLTGDRFQRAMDAAGVPAGLFQHIPLSHEDVSRLLSAGHVDQVNFTGSVEGGKAIEQAAAGSFAGVGLELGGKDPAYVRADADLSAAIENLVDGAFYNSGQCCCGIERIYVDAALHEPFVEGFTALARQYVLGDPLQEATTLGPMAQARFAALVREQTAEALAKGAIAHIDAKEFPADRPGTPYLAPQVLTNVDHGMRVMTQESFGPVVGIMKVSGDDEAVRLMNDSPYGLTASIWTGDDDDAETLGARIETGTIYMNRCDYLDPGLVWTGVKNSGRGVSLSEMGYHALTQPKSYHLRLAR